MRGIVIYWRKPSPPGGLHPPNSVEIMVAEHGFIDSDVVRDHIESVLIQRDEYSGGYYFAVYRTIEQGVEELENGRKELVTEKVPHEFVQARTLPEIRAKAMARITEEAALHGFLEKPEMEEPR